MVTEKRKLIKFSNYSLCITIPKRAVKELNWKKGCVLDINIDKEAEKIIITKNHQKAKKPTEISNNNKENTTRW